MKSSKKASIDQLKALQQLPRDRKTLQYILEQLSIKLEPGFLKLVEEIFEMHRTSAGFNPVLLSKARVKRMKPAEYLKFLQMIDQEISYIMSSNGYVDYLKNVHAGYSHFLTRIMSIQRKFEMRFLNGIENEINNLQTDLAKDNEFELLLSLNKICSNFFEQHNNAERASGYAKNYNRILKQLQEN